MNKSPLDLFGGELFVLVSMATCMPFMAVGWLIGRKSYVVAAILLIISAVALAKALHVLHRRQTCRMGISISWAALLCVGGVILGYLCSMN
jgi:hypothetical protein